MHLYRSFSLSAVAVVSQFRPIHPACSGPSPIRITSSLLPPPASTLHRTFWFLSFGVNVMSFPIQGPLLSTSPCSLPPFTFHSKPIQVLTLAKSSMRQAPYVPHAFAFASTLSLAIVRDSKRTIDWCIYNMQ